MDPNNPYKFYAKCFFVMVDSGGVALCLVLLDLDMEYNSELILLLVCLVQGSKLSIEITVLFSLFLDVQHALTMLQFYTTFLVIQSYDFLK